MTTDTDLVDQKQSSRAQVVTNTEPLDCKTTSELDPAQRSSLQVPDKHSALLARRSGPAALSQPPREPARNSSTKGQTCDTKTQAGGKSTSCSVGRNTKRQPANQKQRQSIDSRSILDNKEKLKRFWETKMELEFRERNQREPMERSSLTRVVGSESSDEIDQAKGEVSASESKMVISREDFDENNNSGRNVADGELISAELLCEKLHAVKRRLKMDQLEGPAQEAAGKKLDAQPMSINPTLCHLHETKNQSRLATSELNEELGAYELYQADESEEQSANEEFSSSNSSFGPMSISVARATATASQDDADAGDQVESARNEAAGGRNTGSDLDDDDDEENSTQSGSVLTVINGNGGAQEQTSSTTNEKATRDKTADQCDDAQPRTALITSIEDDQEDGPEQERDQDQGDGTDIGVAFESLQFDDEIKSSKNELVDEERLLANDQRSKPAPSWRTAPSSSNKSVAWLRAVGEPDALGEGAAANCRPMPKFNSREVKSVCSLIANAVTDASRQVDDCIKSKTLRPADGPADGAVASGNDEQYKGHDVGGERIAAKRHRFSLAEGFQRATFVGREESPTKETINKPLAKSNEYYSTNSNETNANGDGSKFGRHQNEPGPGEVIDDESEVELGKSCSSDDDDDQLDEEISSLELVGRVNDLEAQPPPRTDLSSIFEANVRREIKRFESNATQQLAQLGQQQLANSNGGHKPIAGQQNTLPTQSRFGLTEWRIAEEIRQFNERENELKQRSNWQLQMAPPVSSDGTSSTSQQNQKQPRAEPPLGFDQIKQRPPLGNDSNEMCCDVQQGRSIKLSSSVVQTNGRHLNSPKPQQQSTMISMHKFITSGGKRFVYKQSSNCSLTSNPTNQLDVAHQRAQLTKSMSNLSSLTSSSLGGCSQTTRPVDYRAVDSLRCKEVPNVKPGLAKQTIETFSRLATSGGGSLTGLDSGAASCTAGPTQSKCVVASSPRPNLMAKACADAVHMQKGSSGSVCSAEWKIQEELREMKAREVELRELRSSQQRQRRQATTDKSVSSSPANGTNEEKSATSAKLASENGPKINDKLSGRRRTRTQSANCQTKRESKERVGVRGQRDRDEERAVTRSDSGRPSSASGTGSIWESCRMEPSCGPGDDDQSADQESESAHSLFPIKQTIDSFRKLNASVGATSNSTNQPHHQRRQVSVTHQMERA